MSTILCILIFTSMGVFTNNAADIQLGDSNSGTDWFKHIKLFIDRILPDNPPLLDTLQILLQDKESRKDIDPKETALEFTKAEATLVGFMGFGLLIAILMPFICLGCCCKACCCKTKPASPKSNSSRLCLSFFTLLIVLLALPGIVYMFYSSNFLNTFPKQIFKRANATMDDVTSFLNDTKYKVSDLNKAPYDHMTKQILDDLQHINKTLGIKIQERFDENLNVASFLKQVDNVILGIEYATENLKIVDGSINDEPSSLFQKLLKAIEGFKLDVNTECDKEKIECEIGYENALGALPTEPPDQIPINSLSGIRLADIKRNFDSANKKYNDIPNEVQNEAKDIVPGVKDNLIKLQGNLQDLTDKMSNMTDYVEVIKSNMTVTIDDIKKYIDMAMQYSAYVTLGTSSYIAIIWIMFALGLCLGICFHQKSVMPEERTCGSNTGGCLLILAVASMLCFSSLFWLMSTIIFPIGAHGEKYVCNPLYDENEFKLIKTIFSKIPINLTELHISDILPNVTNDNFVDKIFELLKDCKNNTPAFRAFHLESLVDLDNMLNISSHYDITREVEAQFGNIKISDDDDLKNIFNENMKSALMEAASKIKTLDFEKLKKFFILDEYIKNVTSIVKSIPIEILDKIKQPLNEEKSKLRNFSMIIERVDRLKLEIDELNKQLAASNPNPITATDTVKKGVEAFSKQLSGYAEDYVQNIAFSIKEKVGGCRPVWNLFDTMRTIACKDLVDPLNGFWFGLGSSLFFFLPLSIVACSLSKHFRRLKGGKSKSYYRSDEDVSFLPE